jgi:hypothetical protein
MKSRLFTLDWRDLVNGLLVAFLTALISGLIEILGKGLPMDWISLKPLLIAGISGAFSYLLKSLSTKSQNQLFTREPA